MPVSRPKVSVFIATSLDGFISRMDGDLDWLDQAAAKIPEGEDCGYSKFMGTVDALVMGRATFEKVMSFDCDWPYTVPVVVLSHRHVEACGLPPNVSFSASSPTELCHKLFERGYQHVYIDGGKVIQSFLSEGLVDELTISQIPILLGGGIPLFGELEQDVHWEPIKSIQYDFGIVQTKYRVIS